MFQLSEMPGIRASFARREGSGVSYQLLQVVLYRVRVNHNADGHQGVESKVKYLVAEKWDNPGGTQLKQTQGLPLQQALLVTQTRRRDTRVYLVSAICCHPTYQYHEQRDGGGDAHV